MIFRPEKNCLPLTNFLNLILEYLFNKYRKIQVVLKPDSM